MDDEQEDSSYTQHVGLRLRAVRRQKRFSLHEVEVGSNKEFKASVLGAYERGERAISVPRLQRLASYYQVAVDSLLPPVSAVRPGVGAPPPTGTAEERRSPARGITIDLTRLDSLNTHEATLLRRYVSMIKAQRQGFSGSALTMRREDLNALAVLLETDVDTVKGRIEDMGFEPVR